MRALCSRSRRRRILSLLPLSRLRVADRGLTHTLEHLVLCIVVCGAGRRPSEERVDESERR
eukprot:2098763-Prymnesium_polylepis.1